MRLVIAGLALALAAPLSGAALMQGPVTTQPLAPGEVLLQLNATGTVSTPADVASTSITVAARGETDEEARAGAEAKIRRVVQIARAAGIAADDIRAGEIHTSTDYDSMMIGNSVTMEMNMMMPDYMAAAETGRSATAVVEVRLRDVARLAPLMRAMDEIEVRLDPVPVYALLDASAPRREARNQALAAARADAEAYAATLGMRVVRIVRVTERLGMDFFSMMMNESEMRRQMSESQGAIIRTSLVLGVDFALAPR